MLSSVMLVSFFGLVTTYYAFDRDMEAVCKHYSEMGEYIVTARRSGDTWYIGGLNNWTPRDITLNVEEITGKSGDATIHMASGGGFALIL